MSDRDTTIAELADLVRHFVDERNWGQFHSPKNLAMGMAIEAAELMEHFQWLTTDASRTAGNDAQELEAISDELADVFCYVLALANEMKIDVATALRRKMVKNVVKYPAQQFRGRFE
jgi:NTP pyrophosphatase (non-canonical NTP hydrolase)